MSATVAAALKKIAVAILTDKKLRKTFLGIVLGIIVIIVMPFAAIIALFNGGSTSTQTACRHSLYRICQQKNKQGCREWKISCMRLKIR